MLKIITAANAILSDKAKVVAKVDKSLLRFIEEMKQTLASAKDPIGVGLAAPQVGKSLRIILIRKNEKVPILTLINPEIQQMSKEENDQIIQSEKVRIAQNEKRLPKKNQILEGCLSLPNIWGYLSRKKELKLTYQDESNKRQTKIFRGFLAVIIQHEIDHLNGILFTKRVLEQKGELYKSKKNEKNEDIFEEINI